MDGGGGRPLAGVRVLELADGAAGGFCGRQFAQWGAEVVLLEAQGGSPLRTSAPLWRRGDLQGSAAFDVLAAGKASVPLASAGALMGGADVLVCDLDPAELTTRLGVDLATLRRDYPGLVVVMISAFGRDGPRAGETASAAELEALSGYMSLNGPADGPPMASPPGLMAHAIGANAFVGALAALIRRERVGVGDVVDVSGLETVATFVMWLREQHQSAPTVREGGTPEGARLIHCRDGLVSIAPAVAAHLPAYREVLEIPESIAHDSLVEGDRRTATDRAVAIFSPYAARLSVEEVFLGLQVRGVACGKVQSLAEVLADRQLEDRGFFATLAHAAGPTPVAGRPARMTGACDLAPRAAPSVGSTDAAALKWAPRAAVPRDVPNCATPSLQGVRVLDLTQAWIGPMVGVLLADLGADVVKVEGVARPDIWRFLGQATDGPGADTTGPLNRSWYFNGANRNKRGVGLDLSQPAGAAAFLRMAAKADIVLENFTPSVMGRFGLDYPRLAAARPDVILTSFSGFGADGPHAGFKANGASIEALAGWDTLHRDAHGEPILMGGYPADPICGLQMAACTLVALYRRLQTGAGAHVEGSMMEAAAGYIGDALLAEGLAQAGAEVMWPEHAACVQPAAGRDRWVVSQAGRSTPIRTTWEALHDPQLVARDWFVGVDSPGLGPARLSGALWRFAEAGPVPPSRSPRLGEHTIEVLAEALSRDEIEALLAAGVAGLAD